MNRLTIIFLGACLLVMSCSLSTPPTEIAATTSAAPTAQATQAGAATSAPTRAAATSASTTSFTLTSTSFKDGDTIPKGQLCKTHGGDNRSPQLSWGTPPSTKTASFTLIMEDLDDGPIAHWVIYNMLAPTRRLEEDMTREKFTALKNGVMSTTYIGPCWTGAKHHFVIRLYALDTTLPTPASTTTRDGLALFEKIYGGHILNTIELAGTYSK